MNSKQTEGKDPFIEKHLAIIKQKIKDGLIEVHIARMGELEKASIKYFLEKGTVNGSFRQRLNDMLDGMGAWKSQQSLPAESPVGDVEESGYAAAPQKGMEFVEWQLCPKCNGDGNLARYNSPSIIGTDAALLCDICKGAKMIPKIALDASPSPSEAGDGIEIIDGYTQLAIDKRSLPKDGQHVKFMTENEEFHEGYFVGGDDIFHVTDSKFFFKWHVQQWKVI